MTHFPPSRSRLRARAGHALATPPKAAIALRPGTDGRLSRSGRLGRRLAGLGRVAAMLAVIWVVGLIALAAVIRFERRADMTRQAQVVIAQMRNDQTALLGVAFDPAITAAPVAPAPAETAARLEHGKRALSSKIAALARLGHSDSPARLEPLIELDFAFVDRLSRLITRGSYEEAALGLGRSRAAGGIDARLTAELDRADARYDADASQSKRAVTIGTAVSIISLLVAFSIAFQYSIRSRRRALSDAMTDALTGLGNRRKLFADMEGRLPSREEADSLCVGMFDLDGFKAYNDTFGHPAGDALLARLGQRLDAVVERTGTAFRIGGDEFVVIAPVHDGEALLAAAKDALTERGEGFTIGCSLGSTRLRPGMTLEQALHAADQRLYASKRASHAEPRLDVKDALLQVLAEQDVSLVTHLSHVAALAEGTAIALGLSPEEIKRTRLAAELHDIGKTAIPASILAKAGPLDADERSFMQSHSVIGERIVAAALTLEAIAPIVRSAHERADGTGYPDGLLLDEIPVSARVIAVVDAYDAMTSDRPYQAAMSDADAFEELLRHSGTQFDPTVVDAFLGVCAKQLDRVAA